MHKQFHELLDSFVQASKNLSRLLFLNQQSNQFSLWKILSFFLLLSLLSVSSFLSFGSSYSELEKIRSNPDNVIAPFTTDGCSGGMSSAWRSMGFKNNNVETRLPWLSCCLAHDESYWRGGSAKERLASDESLKQCVSTKGYPKIAELMFHSVRIGGGPCTGLSWRWGYGWKSC